MDAALQERRREAILEQATAIFAQRGFPNTDVQDIADSLKISKGTVYRYFPSKERLFLAAVERGVKQLQVHIDGAVEPVADPVDRMAVAARAYLEFFSVNPQLAELFVQERAEFRSGHKPVYFEFGDANCAQKWEQDVVDLIACGRVRPIPVSRVMNGMGDLLYGTMLTNHFVGRRKDPAEQAADVLDVFFNGVLGDAERIARRGPERARNGKVHRPNGVTKKRSI